jgi:hypothetical protein
MLSHSPTMQYIRSPVATTLNRRPPGNLLISKSR